MSEDVREQLLALSPATADRLLRPLRQEDKPRGISTTKGGTLLKHQVPVRTFADWADTDPDSWKRTWWPTVVTGPRALSSTPWY